MLNRRNTFCTLQFWPYPYPDSSNCSWHWASQISNLQSYSPGVSLQTLCSVIILALFFSVLQSKSRETKATDSSILCCSLRGPTQFTESQGHSLCLPLLLSQNNFCFYLYGFWSIRSFISYSYTDSSSGAEEQICHKGRDLPPQTTDILLLRAGQLVTHPFTWVGDAECLYLRVRAVCIPLLILPSPHGHPGSTWDLRLFTHCSNLRLPSGHQNYCDKHLNIFMYIILSFYFTLIISHFTHPFGTFYCPSPPLHHYAPAIIKSSFQKQWHFKSARTKTSLPNPAWYQYS